MSGKKTTIGDELRELAGASSREALKCVDKWERACRRHMEDAAKYRQETSAEIEVHSIEAVSHGLACSYDKFIEEFEPAAKELRKRLEADGSVKASYKFVQTKDETIDGGMEQSWRDVHRYPASYKLIFKIRW